MNKHFQAFQKEISWFNYKKEPIEVFEIEKFNLTHKFQNIFPSVTELIDKSQKIGVEIAEKSMILFTWEIGGEISGWLCQFDKPKISIIEEHQILIDNIGGIIESFNGPHLIEIDDIKYNRPLNLNQYFMFVGSLCSDSTKCDWEEPYLKWCEKINVRPIDLSNCVFFTREANGDNFFYDRHTKEIKLFAHDSGYQFIKPVPNQPERSIYTVKGVSKFDEFVELLAKQWLRYFELKKKVA